MRSKQINGIEIEVRWILLLLIFLFTACQKESVSESENILGLRSIPIYRLSGDNVQKMLERYDFYCQKIKNVGNPNGQGIFNKYELQKEGKVVFDKATGLYWQQGYSQKMYPFLEYREFIDELNEEKYAGFNDWRMPTLEELLTLMESTKIEHTITGIDAFGNSRPEKQYSHIDSIFKATTFFPLFWTADAYNESSAWMVAFSEKGLCGPFPIDQPCQIRAVRSGYSPFKLRKKPKSLSEEAVEQIIDKYDFFVEGESLYGFGLPNFYELSNDSSFVIDKATGLFWQQNESNELTLNGAYNYVDSLNHVKFSGYSDWRIPTFEELLSLNEPKRNKNGYFINTLFSNRQSVFWSADTLLSDHPSSFNWIIMFENGSIGGAQLDKNQHSIRAVRSN